MQRLLAYGDAFASLIMPRRCPGCDGPLLRHERDLCTLCSADLPYTHHLSDAANPVAKLFHGKVELVGAGALLKFNAGGKVEHMLHRLKYKGDRHIGLGLGRMMGQAAMQSPLFATVDTVMAVPLHWRKERQRGYNQAQLLADGLREVWPLRRASNTLLRAVHTATQTRKGRFERWSNVRGAFSVGDAETLHNAHVLLVDDVVTTGATPESCAHALLGQPGVRVSVLAAAHA